jgi:NADPH2 dehydrogenase
MPDSRLFKPIKLGSVELKHRIAMAPLTRFRASDDHVIPTWARQYYRDRASYPGTLIITEATIIKEKYGGYPNVPGIYSQEQITGWKAVVDDVHKKGSFIFLQLWAVGRVAVPAFAEASGFDVISSSASQLSEDLAVPREMSLDEIKEAVAAYAQAAKNGIAAGFDGIEIHGANGYLVDQFIQESINNRTDAYGGSVENRSRFAVEVTKAVVDAVGADRTAIRLSPFSEFQVKKMENPVLQFTDLVKKLDALNPAYIHFTESRVKGFADVEGKESLTPLLSLVHSPVLVAGGFKADNVKQYVDGDHKNRDVIVVFGRWFVSTPDLVFRLDKGIDFNPYDRETFYGPISEVGYNDYPFSEEWMVQQKNLKG